MCGIVGYIGKQIARPLLINGLKRLEYRGYDSSGIATLEAAGAGDALRIDRVRAVGRISELEQHLDGRCENGTVGLCHTRWATHGAPTEQNAHPHTDCTGTIAVVHNGIIENFEYLRSRLKAEGHTFKSETDTEVLAHLIKKHLDGSLEAAVRKTLKEVEGTFGIAVISTEHPDELVVARNGSPLCIGIGDGEYIAASDVAPIIERTRQIVYLDDNEIGVLKVDGFTTLTIDNEPTIKRIEQIHWDVDEIGMVGHDTFMHKEIFEQPKTTLNTFRGRLDYHQATARLGGLEELGREFIRTQRIIMIACGTAWHACLVGELMMEDLARLPVEVEYASEFRYRNPIIPESAIVLVVSQSGETADTLAALKEAQRRGAPVLAISNVVGSTIARASDAGTYIHAGPEIGVASTKAFTSQVTALYLMSLMLGRARHIGAAQGLQFMKELETIPAKIEQILDNEPEIRKMAALFEGAENCLYLGRGYQFPVALEGALKMKEISYVHAEGYPAAEMKHGPIALITSDMPVIFIAPRDSVYDKVLANIQEVKARGGRVIAIASEGDEQIYNHTQHVIHVPNTIESLSPLLTVIPLQLLAYHVARTRGCDVDKPRNLAKSVTVE